MPEQLHAVTLVVNMPITKIDALDAIAFAADGGVDGAGTMSPRVWLAPHAWAEGPSREGLPARGTGAPDDAAARTTDLWAAAATALGQGADSPAAALLRGARDGLLPDSAALRAVVGAPQDGSREP